MHCVFCKPQTLVKANRFVGMLKQKTKLYHSGLLQVFLALSLTSQVLLQAGTAGI